MGESVRLTYEQMESNCNQLNAQAGTLTETIGNIHNIVSQFTGVWEGEAEMRFEEDYDILKRSLSTATETMQEITKLVNDYVSAMREVETAFAKNHVTMG